MQQASYVAIYAGAHSSCSIPDPLTSYRLCHVSVGWQVWWVAYAGNSGRNTNPNAAILDRWQRPNMRCPSAKSACRSWFAFNSDQ